MAFEAALVDFTKKDEREHPKFVELLKKLRRKISVDGTSVSVRRELVEARREAEDVMEELCKGLVLKEACDDVMTQQYKVEGGKDAEGREAFIGELDNWYDSMLHQECISLNIPGYQVPEQPPVNEKFVKRIIIPLIQSDLQKQTEEVIEALEARCSVDEVHYVITSMVDERDSLLQELCLLNLEHERMLNSFEEVLVDHTNLKLEHPVASAAAASMEAEVELLKHKGTCGSTKMRLNAKEMYTDTYSEENVDALKYIRKELQREVMMRKKDIREMEDTLKKFGRINPRIKDQITEYGKIKMEVDRLKTALDIY